VDEHDATRAPALEDLRLWGRFHVRLTVFYGGVVVIALAVMTAVLYSGGVELAMRGIRSRVGATALALARGIDADHLAELKTEADTVKPEYAELLQDFKGVIAAEKDLVSIYVLVPAGAPGMFRFAFDYEVPGKSALGSAKVGQAYDARANATLQRGMKDLSIEAEVSRDAWGDTLSGYAPVVDAHGAHVALVGVDADARAIAQVKERIFAGATGLCFVAALILGVTGFFVGRDVHEPVTRLIGAAGAIAAGKLDTRVNLTRKDEFGLLGAHFDRMAIGLEERDRIRSTFGRYVSEDVAKRVLSGPDGARMGGEVRDVTVLFSDLRGYSTISETLSPPATVEFLNEYLSVMNEVIDAHGGVIIEFLGDAILAVFGAPSALDGHPERAVRCAMAMRDALAVFNQRMDAEGRAPWKAKNMAELGQRIGIHSGEVVAGNLGSRVRVKYAVIGDAVNVASRCEALNKTLGTDILCTSVTWERLPDDLRSKLTDRGVHEVKGRAQRVAVFSA
jgi:class 3 adenylate cyclase